MTEERQIQENALTPLERSLTPTNNSIVNDRSISGDVSAARSLAPTNNSIVKLPANQVTVKRGFPVYRTNPSIPPTKGMPTRSKRFHVPGGKAAVIVDDTTGEIKGIGGMGFWWEEQVDPERFVKLYLDGIKQAAGLSKTGVQVFELVYHQMRINHGSDEIKLNQYLARDHGMSDRTYQRGVRELLEKEFLFRSQSDGVFFVNIRFMFNGDRLAFVKSYHLKGSPRQAELPLVEVPSLPAPPE